MATEPDNQQTTPTPARGLRLSLDWWAVITALIFVLLILSGIIPSVSW